MINQIIENVNNTKKPTMIRPRQKWKHTHEPKQNTNSIPKEGHGNDKSFLPVRMEPLIGVTPIYGSSTFERQHPIFRSSISSARWQRTTKESFDFPVISSRENKKSSHLKTKKFSPRSIKNVEEKSFTLPPIRDCPFHPDDTNKGFFLRSNSCNTYKRDSSISKSRKSFRTSSSRITDS